MELYDLPFQNGEVKLLHFFMDSCLVANAFFRAGYIESWGRCIEKIARECREHDIATLVYEFDRSGLMITFHANPEHVKKAMGGEKFGDSSEKMINYVRKNPRMTISELAKELGLSPRGVEKQIANLKSDGILRRIGPAKSGYWVVKDKDQE